MLKWLLILFTSQASIPTKKVHITLSEYTMGRDKQYPSEYTPQIDKNARDLIRRVNGLFDDMKLSSKIQISSGWRPESVNKKVGGAEHSAHVIAKAIDIRDDKKQSLAYSIINSAYLLKKWGLFMEHPDYTKGKLSNWVHLDTRKRANRDVNIFKP